MSRKHYRQLVSDYACGRKCVNIKMEHLGEMGQECLVFFELPTYSYWILLHEQLVYDSTTRKAQALALSKLSFVMQG